MVARTIMPQEARKRDDCEKVVMEEYNKLRGKVWQEENVREWSSVVHEARQEGREIHVGSLHELVVEKGSEVQVGDKNRKFKGRVVFLGDRVRDADGKHAVFEELSSSPAAMSAGKFADAYGCMPGNIIQTADGIQAYPQAKMASKTKTWIRLPPHRRPKSWEGIEDPVVEMTNALYGHPDAGGYWGKAS